MKKFIVAVLLFASAPFQTIFAQDDASFAQGDVALNVGLGYLSRESLSGLTVLPALAVSADYGIVDLGPGVLGVGGALAWQYAFESGISSHQLVVGPRVSYTLGNLLKSGRLNVYAASQFGLEYAGVSTDFGSASDTDFYYGIVAGGRYLFTPSFGVFLEAGYDITYLKAGVSFKF